MKQSIKFWILCASWGVFVFIAPVIKDNIFLRSAVWYFVVMYFKHSGHFFAHAEKNMRFRNKETILVTGASAGIGAETAKQLTERGGRVIWVARDTKKAEARMNAIVPSPENGPRGRVMHLDLADMESIREFAAELKRTEKRLDCLILNAGYHGPKTRTVDGFDMSIGVNHLGHMYLTSLLLDLLKDSAPSRIVVVASDLHRLTKAVRFDDLMFDEPASYARWTAYNHSKLCNAVFGRELAHRLNGSGIMVQTAHPGTPVQSELMRSNWFLGSFFMDSIVFPPVYHFFCRKAYDGAQTLVHCALNDQCRANHGLYFENVKAVEPSDEVLNNGVNRRLWDVSCDLLNIDNDWTKAAFDTEKPVQNGHHAA